MKHLLPVLLLLLSAAAAAVCPLGLTPEEACPVDSPSCALFADGDGDDLCDNPEPQSAEEEPPPEPDSLTSLPDTLAVEPDTLSMEEDDPVLEDTSSVETDVPEEVEDTVEPAPETEDAEAFCPLGFTPETACPEENPSCALYVDDGGDAYCDNPGPRPVAPEEPDHGYELQWDSAAVDTASVEVSIVIDEDSVVVDSVIHEEIEVHLSECPLNLPLDDACWDSTARCTFFTDGNADLRCDNPVEIVDSLSASGVEIHENTYPRDTLNGCPLSLPPAAACPTIDSALCPHYMGAEGCTNPSGGGMNRALVVLIGTAVLLPVSTYLRRRLRGRGKNEKRRRKIVHITVYIVSIAVLGFVVQGCYCQLGIVQYLFLPGGLSFLGGLGLLIIVLPMIWALFYGRVFCGWVCPFGALQSLLGHLNLPRPPRLPYKVHRYLIYQKYVLTVLFFLAVFLAGRGVFGRLVPAALWCQVDPFHTVFSFFVVGSFLGGVALVALAIFFPRFFCKYLCFYGTVLSLLGRSDSIPG